jgi:hypothetical protein
MHSVHVGDDGWAEYLPNSQTVHVKAPLFTALVPAGHAVHMLAPDLEFEYFPGTQFWHWVVLYEYFPALHGLHVPELDNWIFPPAHTLQTATLVAAVVLENVPAGHDVQDDDPGWEEYFPERQTPHTDSTEAPTTSEK